MTDKTPNRPPHRKNNNDKTPSKQLDFRSDEEIATEESAEQVWWDFIARCLESLKISLQHNLPITPEGSQAALFVRSKVHDNMLLQLPSHSEHTETSGHDATFSTGDYHTPSNPRQRTRTILHKNPATLELTRLTFELPNAPAENDPEEGIPEAGFTYTTADGRTFVGSPQLDATHEDSVEITHGVDDQTPQKQKEEEESEELETPGAPIAPHRRPTDNEDESPELARQLFEDDEDITSAEEDDIDRALFDALNEASANSAQTNAAAPSPSVARTPFDDFESDLSGSDDDEDDIM